MSKLKRDVSAVLPYLTENKSGQIITSIPCKIQVPARFTEIGLGQIGVETFIYGLYPVITETGDYMVSNINALVEIDPFKISQVTIDDVLYHEFYFPAESVLIKNTTMVKTDTLLYYVFDEFFFKGKIPWYVGYEDLGRIFDTANYHAGSNIGRNWEVIEFLASMVTRSKTDRTKYIRTVMQQYNDSSLNKIDYVPLKSVLYSVNSTTNKLAGSYFNDGVISALVNPTDRVDKIEQILRT